MILLVFRRGEHVQMKKKQDNGGNWDSIGNLLLRKSEIIMCLLLIRKNKHSIFVKQINIHNPIAKYAHKTINDIYISYPFSKMYYCSRGLSWFTFNRNLFIAPFYGRFIENHFLTLPSMNYFSYKLHICPLYYLHLKTGAHKLMIKTTHLRPIWSSPYNLNNFALLNQIRR